MSRTIGVRELKNQASRVLQAVQEEMIEYVVTVRGRPVAVLSPYTAEEAERHRLSEIEDELREMEQLAEVVGAAWLSTKSGVELVEGQRR